MKYIYFPDRRKYPRVEVKIPLKIWSLFSEENYPIEVHTLNLSKGGTAIILPLDISKKGKLLGKLLCIEFSNNKHSYVCTGEVVWCASHENGTSAAGIQFTDISKETKDYIFSIISRHYDPRRRRITISHPRRLEITEVIKQDIHTIYNLFKAPERLKEAIRTVQYIKVLHSEKDTSIIELTLDMEGAPVNIKLAVKYNDFDFYLSFHSLRGDISIPLGEIILFPLMSGTEITLRVDVDWELPVIESFSGDLLYNKLYTCVKSIFANLKEYFWNPTPIKASKFGCIIHPLSLELYTTFEKNIKNKNSILVEQILKFLPPFLLTYATGIKSKAGKTIDGELVICNLLPHQILEDPNGLALDKVYEAGLLLKERGVKLIGLGAYISGVGRKGILLEKRLGLPVTTGTSYTVAVGIEAIYKLVEILELNLSELNICVVGATGSIGSTCSIILAPQIKKLFMVGRNLSRLKNVREKIETNNVAVLTDPNEGAEKSDIVITATNTPADIIDVSRLKPGTIVYDFSLPKNISFEEASKRNDILVIDGGLVNPPGEVNFNLFFGLPLNVIFACVAETIILTLEERFESFSIGGKITPEKVKEIMGLAQKHGFKLANFRSFGKDLTFEQIESLKTTVGG